MNRFENCPLNDVTPSPGGHGSQRVNMRSRPNRRPKNEGLGPSINNLNASIVMATAKLENLEGDMDLRKDYQEAVDCLKLCESIIGSLEEKLSLKDEELASKNKQIESLEEKIVQMSLELASTKASEQELKHKIDRRNSQSSVSSNLNGMDVNVKASFTTACTSKTSFSSLNGGWNLDDSVNNASIISMSSFGHLFRRRPSEQPIREESSNVNTNASWGGNGANCSTGGRRHGLSVTRVPLREDSSQDGSQEDNKEQVLVQFPKRSYEDMQDLVRGANGGGGGYQPRRRRPNGRARMMRQKSSRSFLENHGVVFPVSSTDCIDKGCLSIASGGSKGDLANEEWPEFR